MWGLRFLIIIIIIITIIITGITFTFSEGGNMRGGSALASGEKEGDGARIVEVNLPGLMGAGPFRLSVVVEMKDKGLLEKGISLLKRIGGRITPEAWDEFGLDVTLSGGDGHPVIIGRRDSLDGAVTLFNADASGLEEGAYTLRVNLYRYKDGQAVKVHSAEVPIYLFKSITLDRDIESSKDPLKLKEGDVYLITDLSRCIPTSSLSIVEEAGKWLVYPYVWGGLDYGGMMLIAKSGNGEVTLPLNLEGRYAIYVGYDLISTAMLWRFNDESEFRVVKFEGLAEPHPVNPNQGGGTLKIKEYLLATAELGDRSLILKPPSEGRLGIAYLRFVAIGDGERRDALSTGMGGDVKMIAYNGEGYGSSHLFGGGASAIPSTWRMKLPEPLPLVHRDDGFSTFFGYRPYMSREALERRYIDYLRDTNVKVKEWGLGPGSVFCYDTKVGEIFLEGVKEEQLKMFREGDRWVHDNVKALIDAGHDPLKVAAERGHQIGLKVWARLEMNHEYGPPRMDNWMWVGFVGRLNKEHPEYRIAPGVNLDFKYKEVRDFKLAILREAAERGVDGISMDFVVYPPHLSDPVNDRGIMTQFIRDVRKMLDEVGKEKGRRIDLIVRVPFNDYEQLGLDWKTWIKEGLIDIIIPSIRDAAAAFDVPIEEFVEAAAGTKTKVYGCIRPLVGNVTTDQQPGEMEKGLRRYDRPITDEMYRAKAMLLLRAGADGIQLAMGSADTWQPVFNELGDARAIQYKDKDYLVNRMNQLPAEFWSTGEEGSTTVREVELRIGDDIATARNDGYTVDATLVFFSRSLSASEKLSIYVNGNGPLTITAESFKGSEGEAPIEARRTTDKSFIFDPDWWKKGMRQFSVPADWWRLGVNRIRMEYSGAPAPNTQHFRITDMNLLLRYRKG